MSHDWFGHWFRLGDPNFGDGFTLPVNTPITCVARTPDHMDLFAVGKDTAVYSTYFGLSPGMDFHADFVTPEGTPLGGWVDLRIQPNGDYHVHFHTHCSSSLGNFDYVLKAFLTAPRFPPMVFLHQGHVSGVDSEDYEEDGHSDIAGHFFDRLAGGAKFELHKDYEWGGPVGTLEDIVHFAVDVVAGAVGTGFGVVIGATREALGWLGQEMGAGTTIGVIAGVVVFAVGSVAGAGVGGALILGVAAGAVASALIKSRHLNDEEIAIARRVFGDTIPYGDIVLTNLSGLGDRAFTAPGVDGKTYVNLGKHFDDALTGSGSYARRGQLLVHELTHAWQIAHTGFLPGLMCSGMVNQAEYSFGDNVYDYGGAGPAWDVGFNLEQQGAIVDQRYGGNGHQAACKPMDQQSPYYRYIWHDVLAGRVIEDAPGTLRASSGHAVGRTAQHLDVFWVRPDASIGSHWWDGAPKSGWGDHAPFTAAPAGAAVLGSPVAVVSHDEKSVDVFWTGADGGVWTAGWREGDTWSAPRSVASAGAAAPGAPVSACSRAVGQIDVFWVAPDGAVWTGWWNADINPDWKEPAFPIAPPGAAPLGAGLAAVGRRNDHLDVFWVEPDGAIATHWWDAAPKSGWGDHSPFPLTGPGEAPA